jgi:hypothetical protein
MAASPNWKVYGPSLTGEIEYLAAFKCADHAASFVAVLGNGAEIVFEHKITLWKEGAEKFSAAESYDAVAELVARRIEVYAAAVKRIYAESKNHALSIREARLEALRFGGVSR